MKLTAAQIKKLPREVSYKLSSVQDWMGRSDGKIIDGLYIVVYPARSFSYNGKRKIAYKKCEPEFVPLTSVFTF